MSARLSFNGDLSTPISVENDQGDIPAPTLFSIFFTVMLTEAFKDCEVGLYLRFRTTKFIF